MEAAESARKCAAGTNSQGLSSVDTPAATLGLPGQAASSSSSPSGETPPACSPSASPSHATQEAPPLHPKDGQAAVSPAAKDDAAAVASKPPAAGGSGDADAAPAASGADQGDERRRRQQCKGRREEQEEEDDDDEREEPSLCRYARRGDLQAVLRLVMEGRSVVQEDGEGALPLHHAAQGGHPAVIELLVREGAGAGLFKRDRRGHTPLQRAVQQRQAEAVTRLLQLGADPRMVVAQEEEEEGEEGSRMGQLLQCWTVRALLLKLRLVAQAAHTQHAHRGTTQRHGGSRIDGKSGVKQGQERGGGAAVCSGSGGAAGPPKVAAGLLSLLPRWCRLPPASSCPSLPLPLAPSSSSFDPDVGEASIDYLLAARRPHCSPVAALLGPPPPPYPHLSFHLKAQGTGGPPVGVGTIQAVRGAEGGSSEDEEELGAEQDEKRALRCVVLRYLVLHTDRPTFDRTLDLIAS